MYFYYCWLYSDAGLAAIAEHNSVGKHSTIDAVDPEYIHCYIKASTQGDFRGSDIKLNNIYNAGSVPSFVVDFENVLSQRRKLAPCVCSFLILFSLTENKVRYVS